MAQPAFPELLQETFPEEQRKADVAKIIQDAHILLQLTKPILLTVQFIGKLLRWHSPFLCVTILIICNSACLVTADQLFVIPLLVLVAMAILGYTHRCTKLLAKVLPQLPDLPQRKQNNSLWNDLTHGTQQMTNDQLVQEMKVLLGLVSSVTHTLTVALVKFYRVLIWHHPHLSLQCYGVLMSMTVLMHYISIEWFLIIALDLLFLQYPLHLFLKSQSKRLEVNHVENISIDSKQKYDLVDSSALPKENTVCPLVENVASEEGALADIGSTDSDSSQGRAAEGRRGVVSKLLDLKKRHQQNSAGSCMECSVNFTTILKRRRTCCHCGNHFCSRCCNNKVTRSMFGATAPAAQTETVQVCTACYSSLTIIHNLDPAPKDSSSSNSSHDKGS